MPLIAFFTLWTYANHDSSLSAPYLPSRRWNSIYIKASTYPMNITLTISQILQEKLLFGIMTKLYVILSDLKAIIVLPPRRSEFSGDSVNLTHVHRCFLNTRRRLKSVIKIMFSIFHSSFKWLTPMFSLPIWRMAVVPPPLRFGC